MGDMADMYTDQMDCRDNEYYIKPINLNKKMKSKIKRIESTKPYTNDYGTTIYHNLEMENGDKINIGKKKHQEMGWELTYEIVDSGQEYNKAKSVQEENQVPSAPNTQNKSVTQFKADPDKQASIELQVCFKEANLYHATHGFKAGIKDPLEELVETANYFFEKLFTK